MQLETQIFPADGDSEDELKLTVQIPKKDITELFSNTCYLALQKIREIHLIIDIDDSERMERIADIIIQLEADYEGWGLPPLVTILKYDRRR